MIGTIIKIAVAVIAIGYLAYTDRISPSKLALLYQNPLLTGGVLAILILVVVPLASFRFYLLLRKTGIKAGMRQTFVLTWIGNFFNTTLPGAVSGDIVKGYYLKRQTQQGSKTDIVMTLLFDRIIGLSGLIFVSLTGLLASLQAGIDLPSAVVSGVGLLGMGVVVFYVLLLNGLPGLGLLSRRFEGRKLGAQLHKILNASHEYKGAWKNLLGTLLISIFIHLCVMVIFLTISFQMGLDSSSWLKQMTVIPIGLITVAIPISPSGIGVGHASMEALYHWVGLRNGANIFNIYIILQIFSNLLGCIPYLLVGRKNKTSLKQMQDEVN